MHHMVPWQCGVAEPMRQRADQTHPAGGAGIAICYHSLANSAYEQRERNCRANLPDWDWVGDQTVKDTMAALGNHPGS